jgi:hypothetical protein
VCSRGRVAWVEPYPPLDRDHEFQLFLHTVQLTLAEHYR